MEDNKIVLDYALRHIKVLSVKTRSEYIEQLYNAYREPHPEIKGSTIIRPSESHEFNRRYKLSEIKEKMEKLSGLAILQKKLMDKVSPPLSRYQIDSLAHEIDILFQEIIGDVDQSKELEKDYPFYVFIAALFAQGYLKKVGFDYFYKEESFNTISALSKYIQEKVLNTSKSVRQYLNDTLNENEGVKNIYKSKSIMSNTLNYCKDKNLKVQEEFYLKYTELDNLH